MEPAQIIIIAFVVLGTVWVISQVKDIEVILLSVAFAGVAWAFTQREKLRFVGE